jgi:IMP dehydrogenase/GMP reductase
MEFLAQQPLCTTEDVTILPALGRLSSRADAQMGSLFYNAPMDTVASTKLLQAMLDNNEFAVIDRRLHENDPEGYADFVLKNIRHPNLWFSCGLKDSPVLFERLAKIVEQDTGSDEIRFNILVDIAHGHTIDALYLYRNLRTLTIVRGLMSGSICTSEAASDCIQAGCSHLRVGVGPGAMCSTRVATGIGAPNLSAVYMVGQVASSYNGIEVIADGGISDSGQVVKYLAAGATGVMLGTALASTLESGGWQRGAPIQPLVFDPSQPVEARLLKRHRGQSSDEYQEDYGCSRLSTEGVGVWIEWQGATVPKLLERWRGGIRSGISYAGVTSIYELTPLNLKNQLVRVTPSAYIEGKPNDN